MSPIDDELGLSLDRFVRQYKVTETVEVPDMSKNYGWDGSAWKKLPMVWGYSGQYRQRVEETDATETDSLSGSTVDAGEIWIVNSICVYNITSAMTRVQVTIGHSGGVFTRLDTKITLAQHEPLAITGHFVLIEDDYVYADLYGCTAGDDIYLEIVGYKMLIAE